MRIAEPLNEYIRRCPRKIGQCREDIDARKTIRPSIVEPNILTIASYADLVRAAKERQGFNSLVIVLLAVAVEPGSLPEAHNAGDLDESATGIGCEFDSSPCKLQMKRTHEIRT